MIISTTCDSGIDLNMAYCHKCGNMYILFSEYSACYCCLMANKMAKEILNIDKSLTKKLLLSKRQKILDKARKEHKVLPVLKINAGRLSRHGKGPRCKILKRVKQTTCIFKLKRKKYEPTRFKSPISRKRY